MLPPNISRTNTLSFQEVTARLAAKDVVEGLLTIGSTGCKKIKSASDYDLIVILREMPVPIRVALTYIDNRLTDIIFVKLAQIEYLQQNDYSSMAFSWDKAQLFHWLQIGHIMFDRSGQLQQAQNMAREQPEKMILENEVYSAWFSINYNLKQTRRLLASDDPSYHMAVDLRLLFSLHELWRFYFLFRGLSFQGEKAQFKYLVTHDPEYLEKFRQCLAEGNREQKFQLYKKLVQFTIAPLGALWEDKVTAILPEPNIDWEADTVQKALTFWETLIS
jgi:hypothetical protein